MASLGINRLIQTVLRKLIYNDDEDQDDNNDDLINTENYMILQQQEIGRIQRVRHFTYDCNNSIATG